MGSCKQAGLPLVGASCGGGRWFWDAAKAGSNYRPIGLAAAYPQPLTPCAGSQWPTMADETWTCFVMVSGVLVLKESVMLVLRYLPWRAATYQIIGERVSDVRP
jgi:hypothetical protein